MEEEGSEEEVERSFEEEFASVVAPGEGLEEVLRSLDEELQEGNWKTRLRKEEVASKRAVLQRARAVLESAVKSREGLPDLDPGSSAKKRQARRYAELAATADAEAKLEEAESLISVLQAEFELSLAEAAGAGEEKKEEADGRAGSVAADPVTAATEVKEVKETALGRFLLFLKEELAVPAEFLDRPDFREATETAFGQVEKVAGDVIEEARELYSDLAAELEVVQQQLEEETRRANTELYARIAAEAELAGLQAQAGPDPEAEAVRRAELETAKDALAAKDLEIVQARQEGGCLFKMSTRGLWKRVDTMIANYIEPYGYFPFVPLLAELYDDLQPGARFQRGVMARSDGRGPTVPPHGTSAAWPPGDQHVVRC